MMEEFTPVRIQTAKTTYMSGINHAEDEEDLARPIFHEGTRSYMQIVQTDPEARPAVDLFQTQIEPAEPRDADDHAYTSAILVGTGQGSLRDVSPGAIATSDGSAAIAYEKFQARRLGDSYRSDVESRSERHNAESDSNPHSAESRSDQYSVEPHSNLPTESTKESSKTLQKEVVKIFNLPSHELLVDRKPAWLLKSIMLQGQLFLLTSYLCFYAYFPSFNDTTVKSGYLFKKSRTSSRQHRHWFVLKNMVLSYYDDSADIYRAAGNIDIRTATDAVADVENSITGHFAFRILTAEREYFLRADTASAVNEWIKLIKRLVFRHNNDGDSVKIKIPFSSVLDVERSDILDFTQSIKIKIADDDETFTINEYYFSFFTSDETIYEQVKKRIKETQDLNSSDSSGLSSQGRSETICDTSRTAPKYTKPNFLELLSQVDQMPNIEKFANELVKDNGDHNPLTAVNIGNPFSFLNRDSDTSDTTKEAAEPSTSTIESINNDENTYTESRTKIISKSIGSRIRGVANIASSVVPSQLFGHKSAEDDPGAEVLATTKQFRKDFAFSDEEKLLKTYQAYHQHGVPFPGTLFVSDRHFCFRSSAPGKKERILIPMEDIETAQEEKGFRFHFSGLAINIRAHETMFFEFHHSSERDQCMTFVKGALENLKSHQDRKSEQENNKQQQLDREREEHETIDRALQAAGGQSESRRPPLEHVLDAPPIVFDSPNASMVAFKPIKQLQFTCLTIGSRGDVQPYVALCKGLIADGQKAKIATHEEFREFVESHGIDFVAVDGNPEELMAICVEHGMFTYSFLREASQKFRGWIDDLLSSAWKACQGADVLIESPSAMGGIHIAEALGIPYFRAFTMPWTKTRVYPHAFAVPDSNKGGTYNALTYSAFDMIFWKAISGQVNRWRKQSLGLPSTNFEKLAQYKVPFLYNFSPFVVPPAKDWPEWIRVTGYWFLDGSDDKDDGEKWKPPETVTKFIKQAREDKKKLVYIGFGSIVVSDPRALTKAVVTAVKKAGVRCIMVKGWSDRSSKNDKTNDEVTSKDDAAKETEPSKSDESETEANYGEDILSLDSIPHDWLFPQIDAACHHGGAGSLGASLRAGVPTIVKPFFGDQHFFGDRVNDLGVGVCLKKLNAQALKDAIITCTTDKLIIQKAEKIGEQVRSERGVDCAIENIYRDLEYSRSLIKFPQRATGKNMSEESWQIEDGEDDGSDADDDDIYEQKTDENGKPFSILRGFKDIRLPNPLGSRSGHYGLPGIKLFKHKADSYKLRHV